jgi:hypothetical protein
VEPLKGLNWPGAKSGLVMLKPTLPTTIESVDKGLP